MSRPVPPSCRTINWRDYNAALKQRGSLLIWFDADMEWLAALTGKRGRPATFSEAAIQGCLMLKALFGLPLRQATGLVASLLKLAKLNWSVPDFSTLCRRQQDLTVTIPYRSSPGALHLLIDSTGIKAMGEGEWSCRKHGASRPRQWCKVHLGIDAEDAGSPGHRRWAGERHRSKKACERQPCRGRAEPDRLKRIPAEEPIGTVTAEGAYDTRTGPAAIAAREAAAVIPTRRTGRRRTGDHARSPRSAQPFSAALPTPHTQDHARCLKLLTIRRRSPPEPVCSRTPTCRRTVQRTRPARPQTVRIDRTIPSLGRISLTSDSAFLGSLIGNAPGHG